MKKKKKQNTNKYIPLDPKAIDFTDVLDTTVKDCAVCSYTIKQIRINHL